MAQSAYDQALQAAKSFIFPSVPSATGGSQPVSTQPGYQAIKNQGGFNSPPDTIAPQLMNNIANTIGSIPGRIGNWIGGMTGGNQTTAPAQRPTPTPTFDQQMTATGWVKGPDNIYRKNNATISSPGQITPTPSVAPSPIPTGTPFQFVMGQKDYSAMRPKLQKMYEHYNNPPMSQYIDELIKSGEKHGIDPRVLAFISHVESSGGKSYPTESYNPFGYIVFTDPQTGKQRSPRSYEEIIAGLKGAGFKSLPQAIDAITGRFAKQPTKGYQQFYQNPTLQNLQAAYNANAGEQSKYMDVLNELYQYAQ